MGVSLASNMGGVGRGNFQLAILATCFSLDIGRISPIFTRNLKVTCFSLDIDRIRQFRENLRDRHPPTARDRHPPTARERHPPPYRSRKFYTGATPPTCCSRAFFSSTRFLKVPCLPIASDLTLAGRPIRALAKRHGGPARSNAARQGPRRQQEW